MKQLGYLSVIGVLLAVLVSDVSMKEDITAEFKKILSDFWTWRLKNSPEFATVTGNHDYDDKMEEMTIAAFDRRNTEAQSFLDKLIVLRRDHIDANQLVNYDLLKDNLQTFVDGYDWRKFTYSMVSFMEGPHHGIQRLISNMNFKTKENIETYLKRLEAFAVKIHQYISLMKVSMENGYMLHNASLITSSAKTVPDEINASLKIAVKDSEYYTPLKLRASAVGLDNSTMEDFQTRGENIISNKLYIALRALTTFLTDEYIPKCRPKIGVSSLKGGNDYYKAALKWHLSFDMEPKDVHQLGLDEVKRIKGKMAEVMKKVNYSGTLKEFIAHLKKQPQFFYNTSDELLQGYRALIKNRIRPKIKDFFNNPPDLPIKVVGHPEGAPAAMYTSGSPDGTVPGTLDVDTSTPKLRAKFDMVALTLHEVDPGHHFQVSYMLLTKGLPPFRQHTEYSKYHAIPMHFPFYTAYTEGWGLYGEYVGEEMGVYETEYELFGRYVSEMFRACRLVVDTGIHVMDWTYDEAVQYMADHITDPMHSIKSEIDRYITLPGQACAYKVGEQKILDLRKKAEKRLGKKFNIRNFHDPLLVHGSLPMSLLEEIVDKWTQEVSGATYLTGSVLINTLVTALVIRLLA